MWGDVLNAGFKLAILLIPVVQYLTSGRSAKLNRSQLITMGAEVAFLAVEYWKKGRGPSGAPPSAAFTEFVRELDEWLTAQGYRSLSRNEVEGLRPWTAMRSQALKAQRNGVMRSKTPPTVPILPR